MLEMMVQLHRNQLKQPINESNLLEDGGLGPYRKLGMHVSKSKLFGNAENKLEIPA